MCIHKPSSSLQPKDIYWRAELLPQAQQLYNTFLLIQSIWTSFWLLTAFIMLIMSNSSLNFKPWPFNKDTTANTVHSTTPSLQCAPSVPVIYCLTFRHKNRVDTCSTLLLMPWPVWTKAAESWYKSKLCGASFRCNCRTKKEMKNVAHWPGSSLLCSAVR